MSSALETALELVLLASALPLFGLALYLGALTVMAWPRPRPPVLTAPRLFFDVVVPAHDEASGIEATVESLLSLDYPQGLFRVVVVADNCTDATARLAEGAGALVLERHDAGRRGKGYALAHAFAWSRKDGRADAVAVVDADTVVSKNLLTAFAARVLDGEVAVQADYGVRNPGASWRTRLMTIALALFHGVRSTGRERLGLSCGLRGNGMCFSSLLLRTVAYDAFSKVEDLEFGLRLGRLGHRVAYAPEAHVWGEMVSGEAASRSQRRRWEQGRSDLARTEGVSMLREAINRRSALCLDLALDLLTPPLAQVALVAGLGVVAAGLLATAVGHASAALALFAFSTAVLGLHVATGWWQSGTGLRGLFDLALAPAYVAWKLTLPLRHEPKHEKNHWVRTRREGGGPS